MTATEWITGGTGTSFWRCDDCDGQFDTHASWARHDADVHRKRAALDGLEGMLEEYRAVVEAECVELLAMNMEAQCEALRREGKYLEAETYDAAAHLLRKHQKEWLG